MTISPINQSQLKALRNAALLYLLLVISAPIGLLYVPSVLIAPGDPTATADNIRASEWLFRIGIGSELFHQIISIFLVLALYRLFNLRHDATIHQRGFYSGDVPASQWLNSGKDSKI
jgi:hypothetical protein